MIKVWVLVFYIGVQHYHGGQGGPSVIDNIATEAECVRVAGFLRGRADAIRNSNRTQDSMNQFSCIEITKVSK